MERATSVSDVGQTRERSAGGRINQSKAINEGRTCEASDVFRLANPAIKTVFKTTTPSFKTV